MHAILLNDVLCVDVDQVHHQQTYPSVFFYKNVFSMPW